MQYRQKKSTRAPIGILGDGQLALMLGEAAEAQGVDFLGFGEDPHSSFAMRFPQQYVQGKAESTDLVEFAKRCSVVTLENEFLRESQLNEIVQHTGVAVVPDPTSYRYFQDKLSQRRFYESLDIPGPRWAELKSENPPFEFPFVLKAAQDGYDGHGVRFVKNKKEFDAALKDFKFSEGRPVLAEEKVEIAAEFAQGMLVDGKGNAAFLPLVQTIQRDGTCVVVLSRPQFPESELKPIGNKIKEALTKLSKTHLLGLFNFEFFYTKDGQVLINEGAPRPHNSQHLTIDASPASQFAILIEFLANGAMASRSTRTIQARPSVMVNLLGKSKGSEYQLALPELPATVKAYPKLYLKKECRPGRKMGHLNLVDETGKENLLALAEKVLKEYQL